MRKVSKLLVFTLAIVLLFSVTTLGAEIKDVPESHWAYDSVQQLVEKGYFSLYEDDTFKGTNKVSRYELAEIIARMLEDTVSGQIDMSEEDVDTLRELSLEFRDELVDIANDQNKFSNNLQQVQKKNVIQDEAIGQTNEKITEIQEEVSQIIDEIVTVKELNNQVDSLSTRVSSLEEELDSTNTQLAEKDQMIADLRDELQGTDIQELKDRNSALESKVSTLQSRLQELQENVNNNNDQLAQLNEPESEGSNFEGSKTTLYLGAAVLLALLLGS
ncbi:MAG: S-layer homology domain-containing protein [Bacillota bacterium]